MTESRSPDDRRAQHVALLGCFVQIAGSGLLIGLSFWSQSDMLAALARVLMLGIPIWLVLYLVLNQIRRVNLEALEAAEIQRAREAGTDVALFELDEEALYLEQNRLRGMVHWLLPACTLIVSAFLILGHFAFWGWTLDQAWEPDGITRTREPIMMMWFVIGLGFLCFLYARYAMALARIPQWRLLRGGAVAMAGSALACVVVAVALMATRTIGWAEPLAAYVLRVALLLLGLELLVNFVLDLYRPRVPGEVPRPSFDSRLLGMIAEPGGIAKSIADAVNYQFGFQVSSTWFYQLLQRWLFPLTVFTFLGVVLLSSLVVVDADEQVIVERWGRRVGEGKPLDPGLYVKWPFPKDVVQRAPVRRISEMVIGEAGEGEEHENEAVIWTKAHDYLPELMLVVATPHQPESDLKLGVEGDVASEGTESAPVSLLMVSVPITYRIKDLNQYLYHYQHPEKILEAVAYQYLSDYAASVDYDQLMGPGRKEFNRELRRRIQHRLDELGVGIEIVFAGVRDAHPTAQSGVAEAFEKVVSAQTEMGAVIHRAKGEANRILTRAAGSVARAIALDEAIQRRDRFAAGTPEYAEAQREVEALLMGDPAQGIPPIAGEAARTIADARAEASRKVTEAASKVREFGAQLAAYQAAPELFMKRAYLKVFEGIAGIRKYLIVGDGSNVIVQYETAREAGLDQVLSEAAGENK